MRTSKLISFIGLTVIAMLLSQCEVQRSGCTDPSATNYDVAADFDDGSCTYGNEPGNNCSPDLAGNLVVINQSNQVLYLYNDFALITCIPADSQSFLVNIPNPELTICKLQIWKASDVSDWNNPDIATVYRQWSVALSNTTNTNERATWIITGSDAYTGSGTLNVTYPSIDDYGQSVLYQVDVYLNNKSGAKIASLQPGISGKKVSIDYGVHYLYFHYWYSDPNSTTGEITDIGWSQVEDVVINAGHTSADITIPFYYSNIGKYGEITVYNNLVKAITIYANDALIESIAKVDGSTQGLSVIPAMSSTTFVIPVNSYSITAKLVDGSSTVATFSGIDVLQSEEAQLIVGVDLRVVSIKNSTEENLLLCDEKGNYLGQFLKPGQSTGTILVPMSDTTLMVVNPEKLKSKSFTAGLDVNITQLGNFQAAKLVITSPWNIVAEGHYQSFVIGPSESTFMGATLQNPDKVVLSFEYKVSSEANYDYFKFLVDSNNAITKESGEIDWKSYSITLDPGSHYLEWIYTKDSMFNSGTDNVEIRNINIE